MDNQQKFMRSKQATERVFMGGHPTATTRIPINNSLSLDEIKKRLDELVTVGSLLRNADMLEKSEVYEALGIK